VIGRFEYEFDYLNINLTVFYRFSLKNFKKIKIRTPSTYKHRLRFKKTKKIKTNRLFYVSYSKILYNYFLKFVIHEMNSKMIKSGMVVLI
jgi:hypothetical protein